MRVQGVPGISPGPPFGTPGSHFRSTGGLWDLLGTSGRSREALWGAPGSPGGSFWGHFRPPAKSSGSFGDNFLNVLWFGALSGVASFVRFRKFVPGGRNAYQLRFSSQAMACSWTIKTYCARFEANSNYPGSPQRLSVTFEFAHNMFIYMKKYTLHVSPTENI